MGEMSQAQTCRARQVSVYSLDGQGQRAGPWSVDKLGPTQLQPCTQPVEIKRCSKRNEPSKGSKATSKAQYSVSRGNSKSPSIACLAPAFQDWMTGSRMGSIAFAATTTVATAAAATTVAAAAATTVAAATAVPPPLPPPP